MFLREQQYYDIHFYSLLLFSFFMPIYPRFATPFIVIATINWIISGQFRIKLKQFFKPLPLIFSSVYIIHLIGLLYTTNLMEGLSDVETKLTLILFPLLLFSVPFKNYQQEKQLLIKTFIGGCLVAGLVCLLCATYVYFTTGENNFSYSNLSRYIGAHPGYEAMYMAFSIFAIIHYHFYSKEEPLFGKTSGIILCSFFLLMVFLYASRTAIFATLLLLVLSIFHISYKKLGALKAISISGISSLLFVGVLLLIPVSKQRILMTIKSFQSEKKEKANPNIRIDIWNATMEAIQTNPIIGTGTGDVQDHLMTFHQKNEIEVAASNNHNAHNQFLQTLLALGAIGVIILLLNFVVPLILGVKSGDYLLMMFLFLFIIFSLTESSLERQQGVLFYAFFNSLLAIGLMRLPETQEE